MRSMQRTSAEGAFVGGSQEGSMVARPYLTSLVCLVIAAGCGGPSAEEPIDSKEESALAEESDVIVAQEGSAAGASSITLQWSFVSTAQGWTGGYADYTRGMESSIGFQRGWSQLPSPLTGGGFKLSGNNASDDLWMFASKALTRASHGIVPNALYDVTMTVWVASNAPSGCIGTGGAPGESVWLKGNVVNVQPRAVTSGEQVLFNIAKGNQAEIGPQALAFGDLANGDSCDLEPRYKLLQRTATRYAPVRATSAGNLWVYFGSDSGFESRSTYFIDQIRVTLTRR